MTASRLDPRKRLDLAIRAVALAHQKEPNLRFDIYGKGGEQENLQDLIDTLGANDYIKLRGHADLRDIYPQYELYVTTSQWETFGLTLMEAVGAGLAWLVLMPVMAIQPSSKMVRMAIWFLIARLWMRTCLFLRWLTKLYLL